MISSGSSPSEANDRAPSFPDSLGATYTPHCARIHPARLVRGLADVIEQLGGQIFENTKVDRVSSARVADTPARSRHGAASVHARFVVRATEGFTPDAAGPSDAPSHRSIRS